jgi:hypothetical protein
MKEREVLLDRLGLREAVLVHYDIRDADARARTALHRFVFGRTVVRDAHGAKRTYRYPGLVRDGATWIGQSVLLLPPDLADRLIAKMRTLRIQHSSQVVYVHE